MLNKEDYVEAFDTTVARFLSIVNNKDYIVAPEVIRLPTDSPLLNCVSTPDAPQNLTTKSFKEDFPDGVFVFRTKLPANWREAKYLISFEGCYLTCSLPTEEDKKLALFMRWAPSILTDRGKEELVPMIGEDFYNLITNKLGDFTQYAIGYEPDYRKNKDDFIDFVTKLNVAIQDCVSSS